jgi:hypothetical protein
MNILYLKKKIKRTQTYLLLKCDYIFKERKKENEKWLKLTGADRISFKDTEHSEFD